MATNDSVTNTIETFSAVYVIATSTGPTAKAIRRARDIQAAQHGELTVIVPHVVPHGVDLERCGHDLAVLVEPYRVLLADHDCTTIRIYVGHDQQQILRQLPRASRVIVAGRRPRWWRSSEEQIALALERDGHDVEFLDVDRPTLPREYQHLRRAS